MFSSYSTRAKRQRSSRLSEFDYFSLHYTITRRQEIINYVEQYWNVTAPMHALDQLELNGNLTRNFWPNHDDLHSNVSRINRSSSEFSFSSVATAFVNCWAWKKDSIKINSSLSLFQINFRRLTSYSELVKNLINTCFMYLKFISSSGDDVLLLQLAFVVSTLFFNSVCKVFFTSSRFCCNFRIDCKQRRNSHQTGHFCDSNATKFLPYFCPKFPFPVLWLSPSTSLLRFPATFDPTRSFDNSTTKTKIIGS